LGGQRHNREDTGTPIANTWCTGKHVSGKGEGMSFRLVIAMRETCGEAGSIQ